MSQRPLFLFSLPRSGSTLTQHVLASHRLISTSPEPWLLLPLLYATRERGIYAEYGELPAARALREFVERMPKGFDDYFDELRAFAMRMYAKASDPESRYFLDKTPRYHFVVEDIFQLFPDAKFLFLWRNPLAVVASVIDTWAGGHWSFGRWRHDLFDGLSRLVAAYEAHVDRSCAIRFESLVTEPDTAWPPVFDYLGLSFDAAQLTALPARDTGARMGDPTGYDRYKGLSSEPLDKWKRTLANPLRVRWCRGYLKWIGEHRLAVMGYRLEELVRSLDELPVDGRLIGSDLVRMTNGKIEEARRRAAFRRVTKRGNW